MISDHIVSREQIDTSPTTWMIALDESAIGLEDCGCGKSVESRIVQTHHDVLEIIFYHGADRCMMAFKAGEWTPLNYEEYLEHFPPVAEDEG